MVLGHLYGLLLPRHCIFGVALLMCPLLGLLVRHFAGDFNTHWPDSWRHNFNFGFITGWLLSFISSSKRLPLKVKSRGLLLCFFFFFAAGIQIHFRCFDWEYLNVVSESSSWTTKPTTRWEEGPSSWRRDCNSLSIAFLSFACFVFVLAKLLATFDFKFQLQYGSDSAWLRFPQLLRACPPIARVCPDPR